MRDRYDNEDNAMPTPLIVSIMESRMNQLSKLDSHRLEHLVLSNTHYYEIVTLPDKSEWQLTVRFFWDNENDKSIRIVADVHDAFAEFLNNGTPFNFVAAMIVPKSSQEGMLLENMSLPIELESRFIPNCSVLLEERPLSDD